jgi:hypothetical protein
MKNSITIKKSFLFFAFLFITIAIFADSGSGSSVATGMTTFYRSYIRPILIAWLVIQLAIAGVMANNKIRKHDDESSDAMIGFFKMAIWPVAVLGIAEVGTSLYSSIGTSN